MIITEEVISTAQLDGEWKEGERKVKGGRDREREGEGRDKEKRQSKNNQVHLVYGRDITSRQLELWAG